MKGFVGEEKGEFIIANSLYLVVAGSNDIANTYFTLRASELSYNINSYSLLMANSASAFVQVSIFECLLLHYVKIIKLRVQNLPFLV